MQEMWRPIVGIDGLPDGVYEVSNTGKVRSLDRVRPHGRWPGATQLVKGRELKAFTNGADYRVVCLYLEGGPKKFYVHRLVLTAFDRAPRDDEEVCHSDGNKENNTLENIRWGTKKENYNDKVVQGFSQNGERNKSAKLTAQQVAEIREKYHSGGYTYGRLADEYGVTDSNIGSIIKGLTWSL